MNIQEMGAIGVAFVVVAIVLSFGGSILGTLQDTQTADTYEYNATHSGITAIGTLAQWLPTLALVVVAAIVLGIVVMYLAGKRGGV